jgi:methylated-DNA-[protein]-cysteine S-methyltransferase
MGADAGQRDMTGKLRYTVSNIGVGWVGVLASNSGLLEVTLPQSTAREAERQLSGGVRGAIRSDDFFADLMERLRDYFAGRRVEFNDELDFSAATAFQLGVWRLTRLIPYGETRSYGWLAEQLGKAGAGRAVGQAMARNPLPIIVPCHRVVTSDGKLGGYSEGLAKKRYLLQLESAANRGGYLT